MEEWQQRERGTGGGGGGDPFFFGGIFKNSILEGVTFYGALY